MAIVDIDGAHTELKRHPRAGTVLVLAAVFALILVYLRPLAYLTNYWNKPEYGHGYLIPVIAFFLGWHDLTRFQLRASASWSGIGWLIFGLVFLVIGQLSAFNAASVYGFIIALIGLSMSFAGGRVTRALLPAFGILFFAVPLPNLLYLDLSTRMQLISSTVGSDILYLLGMPVYQAGNVIDLGVMKLEVAEACSGLRYLFPLASFGYLAAYLLEDRLWKRVVVLLSVLPITILINATRIALIGVTVNIWGHEMATGVLHYSEGFVAFLLCGILLLGEIWLLLRIGSRRGRFRLDYFGLARGPVSMNSLLVTTPGICALLLLVTLGAFANMSIARFQVPAAHSEISRLSETIPLSVGTWYGTPLALDPDVIDVLKLTDYFLAEYHSTANAPPVALYMAYFATQSVGAASHSPASCIPSGGWKITDSSVTEVPSSAGRPARSLNRLRIKHGTEEQLVYYWFNEGGETISSPWADKWTLLKNQLLYGRSDGYLVRVTTPVLVGGEAEADERLRAFLGLFGNSFVL